MIPPPSQSQCPLAHSPTQLALSTALLVGIVLSYVPQQLAILLGKSSEGLSPWFLLLGSIATISTVANVLLLQWHVVQCCSVWSPLGCFENALGVIQLSSQAIMFLIIGALYLHYFPSHLKFSAAVGTHLDLDQEQVAHDETAPLLASASAPDSASASAERPPVTARLWTVSRRIALSVLAYLLLTTTLVALALALTPSPHLTPSPSPPSSPPTFGQPAPELVALAGIFGGIATLMSCLQFLPQIIHTYDAKDPGALSIGTMLMQTPGTLLLIYSLSLRPGTNISTYLSYCVSATCQGTLLVLSLVYLYRKRSSSAAQHQHARSGGGGLSGGQEYRYGELIITDESLPAQDIASPVFATLRSSTDVVGTHPPVPTSTTIDVIDDQDQDDESLIEDPPALTHVVVSHVASSASSPTALLPTAPPTITSSGLAPSLIHPPSSHFIPHPSPPHSPLGSMVAVRSLKFGPGAGGASGMDSRSIDTLGSIASGGTRTVSSGFGFSGASQAIAHESPMAPGRPNSDPASAQAHIHHSPLVLLPSAIPVTPSFELDDKVALDAALSAALPPSDADLLDTPTRDSDVDVDVDVDVVAVAIGQALPPSMDSVIEADKRTSGWGATDKKGASASVQSLLDEPLGDAGDAAGDAPTVATVPQDKSPGRVQLDEQAVRSASPVAAEADARQQPEDDDDDDDVDASEMSALAKEAVTPLVSAAETSLVSVGGGSASASVSRRSKGKGKGKNAKKKGGAKGGKVTKRPW